MGVRSSTQDLGLREALPEQGASPTCKHAKGQGLYTAPMLSGPRSLSRGGGVCRTLLTRCPLSSKDYWDWPKGSSSISSEIRVSRGASFIFLVWGLNSWGLYLSSTPSPF